MTGCLPSLGKRPGRPCRLPVPAKEQFFVGRDSREPKVTFGIRTSNETGCDGSSIEDRCRSISNRKTVWLSGYLSKLDVSAQTGLPSLHVPDIVPAFASLMVNSRRC